MTARLTLVLCASAIAALAQHQVVTHAVPANGNVMYYSVESAGASKIVKGAPYSAQIVTEHTQTLADGNTISQKQSGVLYRDSEGRTRREQALGPIGPVSAGPNPPQLIFITDPVAGVNYVLDAGRKTAHKVSMPPGMAQGATMIASGAGQAGGMVMGQEMEMHMRVKMEAESGPAPAQESLGSKIIGGVMAEGTRITATIPAGEMGNERPITTVTEKWYSPQLQATVLTTTTDPLMGQSVYRLESIVLAEPAPTLFEVPSDYTVTDGPGKPVVFDRQLMTK